MKIVLGGAGFIGFHLAHLLADRGESVLVVDNLDETLYGPKKKEERLSILKSQGVETLVSNEIEDWLECLDSATTVFNLAATAGLNPSWTNFDSYLRNNLSFLNKLLRATSSMRSAPLIVQASTSSVYGDIVMGESTGQTRPVSPYGVTKLAAEHLLAAYHRATGQRYHVLRLFSVYGPHQRPDQFFSLVLSALVQRGKIGVFGDGSNRRSNVYVRDAAEAFILAESLEGLPVHLDISGAESFSTLDVIARFSELANISPNLEFLPERMGDQISTVGDLSRTKQVLNWEPSTNFEVGTKELYEHFQSHPEFYASETTNFLERGAT